MDTGLIGRFLQGERVEKLVTRSRFLIRLVLRISICLSFLYLLAVIFLWPLYYSDDLGLFDDILGLVIVLGYSAVYFFIFGVIPSIGLMLLVWQYNKKIHPSPPGLKPEIRLIVIELIIAALIAGLLMFYEFYIYK